MRIGLAFALVMLGLGCAGTFNGASVENRARLEQGGLQVQGLAGGWVQIVAPEGYAFIMPSAPRFEEETFPHDVGVRG